MTLLCTEVEEDEDRIVPTDLTAIDVPNETDGRDTKFGTTILFDTTRVLYEKTKSEYQFFRGSSIAQAFFSF